MSKDKLSDADSLAVVIDLPGFEAAAAAWMRAKVRCNTCRFQRRYIQGFDGEEYEEVMACGNVNGPWYMSAAEDASCAEWEPK